MQTIEKLSSKEKSDLQFALIELNTIREKELQENINTFGEDHYMVDETIKKIEEIQRLRDLVKSLDIRID